ncbi:hypothetical protein ACFWJE_10475 [Streptomyces griseoincarnatus]
MSGKPDLDGVPAPLCQAVEKALAEEPEERPSAAEAARACTELLASQVTQVLARAASACVSSSATFSAGVDGSGRRRHEPRQVRVLRRGTS